MILLVFAFLAVDIIISLPLVITAIVKGDTVFVNDDYTQSDYNVSVDTMKHKCIQVNIGTKGDAKLHCSCLW